MEDHPRRPRPDTAFLDFIEIGTSDFDTEIQKKDNRVGLSIDAVKYYLEQLPEKRGCRKINNGISSYNGEITIHFVSVANIEKYQLPRWVRGCNSVNHYHPTVTKLLLKKGLQIKDIATSYKVPCKTLSRLMTENNVNGLYLLKIDTEGHDSVILQHFFSTNRSNNLLPHRIVFESNQLTSKQETSKTIQISQGIGYDLVSTGGDTVLKLNLHRIKRTLSFTGAIRGYYICDYPMGYDPANLPHENTLEDAQKYCIEHNCSGITFQDNRYEVRNGRYMEHFEDSTLLSWVLL